MAKAMRYLIATVSILLLVSFCHSLDARADSLETDDTNIVGMYYGQPVPDLSSITKSSEESSPDTIFGMVSEAYSHHQEMEASSPVDSDDISDGVGSIHSGTERGEDEGVDPVDPSKAELNTVEKMGRPPLPSASDVPPPEVQQDSPPDVKNEADPDPESDEATSQADDASSQSGGASSGAGSGDGADEGGDEGGEE